MKKTNAARILDSLSIAYDIQEYAVDEEDLSAVHAAEALGIDPDMIFKTLVVRCEDKSILVAVIPGAEELDLKKLAKVSGHKHCELVAVKEIQALTGYIRGGCSPIGMKKLYPTFLDEHALLQDRIYIKRGFAGRAAADSAGCFADRLPGRYGGPDKEQRS